MTKEEIRNRVVEMASGSKGIIVSIPEALAMVGGEMYAYRLLDVAKVRVPQNENPMRCTSVLGGEIIAFTYADAQRLLCQRLLHGEVSRDVHTFLPCWGYLYILLTLF